MPTSKSRQGCHSQPLGCRNDDFTAMANVTIYEHVVHLFAKESWDRINQHNSTINRQHTVA